MGGDTAGAAEVFGVFATVWALMQFLCSPLLGALSDRYGRRPVILISCLGLGLDYIFMAVAPSLTLLFVGRIISGITAATISTAFAYIADVTPADEPRQGVRPRRHGLRPGLRAGPGDRRPAGRPRSAPAVLGVGRGLPDQCRASAGSCCPNRCRRSGAWPSPGSAPTRWARSGCSRSHRQLLGLAAVDFIVNVAHQVLPSVFVLYAAYRYGWGETTVGLTLAFVGVCSALVQGLLVGPAVALARRAAAR